MGHERRLHHSIKRNGNRVQYHSPEPTVSGYVSIFPADAAVPNASAINPVAGGGTVANSGTVGLGTTGAIKILVQTGGPIKALLDITGYYVPTGTAIQNTIPSGQTVTGVFGTDGTYGVGLVNFSVSPPGNAPVALTTANINFAPDASSVTNDDDATCTGTSLAPTAPPGKVCLYQYATSTLNLTTLQGFESTRLGTQAFYVSGFMAAAGTGRVYLSWAYTAP